MGGDPSKVSVVFNGIDMKAYSTLPPRGVFARRYGIEGKRLITYIGRLNARKGLMPMLRAFKEISMETEDTVLVLVGPDEGYRAHLEKASRNLGISERVVFTGFLTGQDRLAAFADSDVVVYPAEHEAFGLVPFEALACGRPVVVSDDSGCGEIIRMASAGFTVPIQDIRRLAAAIIAAANNSPGVEEQIERGKLFLTDRLNWRTVAVELEQVYREAVSKSPKVAIADA
jgi:glycosyltransferase involved in cell wall biosynthesis